MLKMKRAIALLIIMVMALGAIPAHAAGYVSIADIREETKDGWHETYTYKGEEIRVDADIEIPDVDRVPVVSIMRPDMIQPIDEPSNAKITSFGDNVGFVSTVISEAGIFTGKSGGGRIDSVEPGALAENSPFLPGDALQFAESKIAPYIEMTGTYYRQGFMAALSRAYESSREDASGIHLDMSKPLTEMGGYHIRLNQVFYGIPLVKLDWDFVSEIKSEPTEPAYLGDIVITVASDVDYGFRMCPAIEEGVPYENVPLVAFSDVKKEAEKLIESGYVRAVYGVALEYMAMNDPKALGEKYVLVPVWRMNAVIMQRPNDPTPSFSEADVRKNTLGGYQSAVFNAQTAKYYNPEDKNHDRKHGTYITWDEVK